MSRFANPKATERMDLGACACPGTPHERDWMEMRTDLGGTEVLAMAVGDSVDALEMLVVDWNMLDDSGVRPEVSRANIERLYADNFAELNVWIEEHVKVETLPNASAARSRSSSRASGSRIPRAKTAA